MERPDVLIALSNVVVGYDYWRLTSISKFLRKHAAWNKFYLVERIGGALPWPVGVTHISYLGNPEQFPEQLRSLTILRCYDMSFRHLTLSFSNLKCLNLGLQLTLLDVPGILALPRTIERLAMECPTEIGIWDLTFLENLKTLKLISQSTTMVVKPGRCLMLPKNLTALKVDFVNVECLVASNGEFWKLPDGLISLSLSFFHLPVFVTKTSQWSLPETLKSLRLQIGTWDRVVNPTWVLPKGLTHLILDRHSLVHPDCFSHVQNLILLNNRMDAYRQDISKSTSLTEINCRDLDYSWSLMKWPVHLKKLINAYVPSVAPPELTVFQGWYKNSLDLPRFLTHLVLESFNSPVIDIELPKTLKVLSFGNCFHQPVIEWTPSTGFRQLRLPDGLEDLFMGYSFNHPVLLDQGQWILPRHLKRLSMRCGCELDDQYQIKINSTCSSRFNRHVLLEKGKKGSALSWDLPSDLWYLDLGDRFSRPLVVNGVPWKVPLNARCIKPTRVMIHALNSMK